jgi:hypothetical protein
MFSISGSESGHSTGDERKMHQNRTHDNRTSRAQPIIVFGFIFIFQYTTNLFIIGGKPTYKRQLGYHKHGTCCNKKSFLLHKCYPMDQGNDNTHMYL